MQNTILTSLKLRRNGLSLFFWGIGLFWGLFGAVYAEAQKTTETPVQKQEEQNKAPESTQTEEKVAPKVATSETDNAPKTHEFILENGLKVLVRQDNRAPVVVAQVWYKVGSSYEYGGITGVSHVLEHMMFKGTEKYATGEFNRILTEIGARDNAFTSRDYTAYYQVLAKAQLETAFELESDRMRGLLLQEEAFAKELNVVKEERRLRTEDKPTALTYEQFMAMAFMNSPYHQPVVGWMTDLDHLTIDDLKVWYEKWYTPNNATLVVVGDVDPQAILTLAKKYYGSIPKREVATLKPRLEFKQVGERKIIVKAPAKVPYLIMGYKTPALVNVLASKDKKDDKDKVEKWEPYALEVLAGILDSGSSARFSRNLIRGQEIAVSASASYDGFSRLPSLFTVSGTPADNKTVAELRKALEAEIKAVQDNIVVEAELQRVKAGVIAAEVYERDSIQHQATILGALETIGLGWSLADEYVDNIMAVTAEQVQTVAKKYLVNDQLTVAELDPQPLDSQQAPKARPNAMRH